MKQGKFMFGAQLKSLSKENAVPAAGLDASIADERQKSFIAKRRCLYKFKRDVFIMSHVPAYIDPVTAAKIRKHWNRDNKNLHVGSTVRTPDGVLGNYRGISTREKMGAITVHLYPVNGDHKTPIPLQNEHQAGDILVPVFYRMMQRPTGLSEPSTEPLIPRRSTRSSYYLW